MSPFDGWPAPPDPTPADPSSGVLWFCFAVAVFALLSIFFSAWCERFLLDEDERRRRARELERACAEERRECLIEHLIDASPGGRKPWQERRK